MAGRTNASTELVRFWLEARHGCLLAESIPVPVPYAQSDLDLVAMRPTGEPFALPDGTPIGPRLVVECKDEHDWEPTGKEFGKLLRADVAVMDGSPFVPASPKAPVRFSMLREAHYRVAERVFGTDDFDRLFVVHAIDAATLADLKDELAARRIHWLTIPSVVADLHVWYQCHPRPSGLRHSLMGDLWHLLVGFCGLGLPPSSPQTAPPAKPDASASATISE